MSHKPWIYQFDNKSNRMCVLFLIVVVISNINRSSTFRHLDGMLYSSTSLDQRELISNADEYEYRKESIHRFNPVPLIRIERLLNQPIDSVVCTWLVFDIDSLLFIHIIHFFIVILNTIDFFGIVDHE